MLEARDDAARLPRGVRLRLGANAAARRRIPRRLVPVAIGSRSWVGGRRPGRIETARASMQFLLGAEAAAADIERLAQAYLRRSSWRVESRWRPDLINAQEVVGTEHLRAAHRHGNGVLLSFSHHGDYIGSFPSIARAGFPMVTVGDSALFAPDALLWHRQQLRAVTSVRGSEVADVAIGSAGIRDLFAQGRAVGISLDFPGHTPTQMFGQRLMLSSGGIRIAHELGVPVVPVFSERIGGGPVGGSRTVLGEALLPGDFASAESLRDELVRQLETSILAWPEAAEEPLRLLKTRLARTPTEYRPGG